MDRRGGEGRVVAAAAGGNAGGTPCHGAFDVRVGRGRQPRGEGGIGDCGAQTSGATTSGPNDGEESTRHAAFPTVGPVVTKELDQ